MRRLDITGERYGRLVAIRRIDGDIRSRWVLKCDCGNLAEVLLSNIRTGQVISCGCAGSQRTIGERSLKHGHAVGRRKSKTAAAWRNAKTRCFNKRHAKYPAYGGRGITMCPEWADDFSAFLRDMGECPDGLTLERIEVDGNYEPGNCRWATVAEQHTNKRNSINVGPLPLKRYASEVGVDYKRLHYRMRRHDETPQQATAWLLKRRPLGRNKKHAASG